MEGTKEYNAALLDQLDDLLGQLDDQDIAAPRNLIFGASIGQHVRHILEYYALLLTQCGMGRINYDLRERDGRIETQVVHARGSIIRCLEMLHGISGDHVLMMECGLPGTGSTVTQRTSLLRELTYVADHCVHHLAMVRIVVQQELPHVAFPEELGVAAATRNHHAR